MPTRSDATVRATRVTQDEAHWEAEQAGKRQEAAAARRRSRKPEGITLLVLPERRCARCEHWSYPSRVEAPKHIAVNPFGDCDQSVVVTQRKDRYERGQILSSAEVRQVVRIRGVFPAPKEPLRTMGHYGCRQFEEVVDARYDPDADLTDEQRDALEEATQWAS